MKKIIALLFLLVAAPSVFADSILYPDAISKATDLSVNYLSQIFGTVGNVLTGGGSQMMGQLFYVLNNGILLVASVIIAYAVLISTVRLASEGVTMAQGKSTLFTIMKLSIGIALLIPSPSTGYSTLQAIVMRVVVQGVGLADSIWDKGLDYLNKGGLVWEKPTGGANGNSQTNLVSNNNITALYSSGLGAQIFANEVCMYGSRDLSDNSTDAANTAVAADAPSKPMYSMWADETNHTFNFPGLNDTSATSGSACGSVSWNINRACDASNSSADAHTCNAARQAMSSLVSGLLPLAQKYYCANANGEPASCRDVDMASTDYMNSTLFNSLLNYYAAIQSYATINGAQADQAKTAFIQYSKQEGWLNAGRYYWDLMRFTADSQGAKDLSKYVDAAVVDHQNITEPGLSTEVINAANYINSKSDGNAVKNDAVNPDFRAYIDKVYGQAQGGDVQGGDIGGGGGIFSGAAAGVIGASFINPGVGATLTTAVAGLNGISGMFNSPGDNPIQFLFNLGQACLNLTIAIWVIGGVAIGGTMLGFGICQASSPFAVMGQTVAAWFVPMISMIAMMLWMSGFFLSYYVPIYPFMIFLFASIGWFISVIEAMVAAPLVALGLTHPENHDFLGKAEQAIVLLLGVFIQPSLLVMGLIAGVIFSFVTFQLLIYGFSGFVTDIMGGSNAHHGTNIIAAATHSPLYNGGILLTQPVLLIVFCTLTYTLLTQSFSLVFVLRDNVMRWIGAPGSGLQSPEQLTQDTKGALMSYGRASGESTNQGMQGGIKAMDDGGKQIAQENNEQAASTAEGG